MQNKGENFSNIKIIEITWSMFGVLRSFSHNQEGKKKKVFLLNNRKKSKT